jgi:uncharacterized protein (TIGR03435 family)
MHCLWMAAAVAGILHGQTFEAASVKLHVSEPGQFVIRIPSGKALQFTSGRYVETAATLSDLIAEAYDVHDYQISGVPGWAQSGGDAFDIDAKSNGIPTAAQFRQMMQALLADRFHLKLHQESREMPVYALVVSKTGSKMRLMGEDEHPKTYATRPTTRPAVVSSPMPMFVYMLSRNVDRPVVDQTGLTGTYEYANLDWRALARDEQIFSAIQQELGLKLEARKDPVQVLAIDHVEKPSGN